MISLESSQTLAVMPTCVLQNEGWLFKTGITWVFSGGRPSALKGAASEWNPCGTFFSFSCKQVGDVRLKAWWAVLGVEKSSGELAVLSISVVEKVPEEDAFWMAFDLESGVREAVEDLALGVYSGSGEAVTWPATVEQWGWEDAVLTETLA